MTTSDIGLTVLVACLFILWPFAGKLTGTSGPWLVTIVLSVTAIVSAALAYARGELTNAPSVRTLMILLIAGLLNGVGCYLYATLASNPRISTASFVVTINITMCVAAPLIEATLLKRVPNVQQWCGFGFAATAVYLLK